LLRDQKVSEVSLTGAVFLWTMILATLAAFAWSILTWNKGAGTGWWAILRRIGRQLTVTVLVVLTLGAGLNRQYDWYANWSDLGSAFSNSAPTADVQVAGAAPSAAAAGHLASSGDAVTGNQTGGVLHPAASLGLRVDPGRQGQYKTFTVPGPISGHSGPVTIWFPSDYGSQAQSRHRFPVIEAFHGIPGSPLQLTSKYVNIGATLSDQVAAGHLRAAIVVMPDYTPQGIDTECVNGTGNGPRMEDWLTKDIPEWINAHIRVDRDRGSWATLGFSGGAWCAAMSAMLHPETYAAGVSLDGYFQPTFERPYIPFSAGSAEAQRYDMVRLAHTAPPRVALWILTSKTDALSYDTARQLLADARAPLSITAVVLATGGHRTSLWKPFLPQTMQWLGSNLAGFARLP
jgi:enterochelin esterase-like enzyme